MTLVGYTREVFKGENSMSDVYCRMYRSVKVANGCSCTQCIQEGDDWVFYWK